MTEHYTWDRLENREATRKAVGLAFKTVYCIATLCIAIFLA
jgi:hypothetical protein